MLKSVLKFIGGGLILILVAAGAVYGIGYWKYQNSPEYRAEQNLKALEKKYAEDPYGGETPEETLRLFIDALKKGDTDLAAKYFILDKQQEWREDLAKIKEKNFLDKMIIDVEKLGNKYQFIKNHDDRFIFETYNEQQELILQADLARSPNNKWKILDL